MTRDLVLQITVKNARLLRAIRGAGFKNVAAFSRACGVSNTTIGNYLALKLTPMTEGGEWRASAQQMADFLRCMPEDLFPSAFLRARLETNKVEREVSQDLALGHMLGGARSIAYDPERSAMLREAEDALREVIAGLSPRRAEVVRLRYGIDGPAMTLDEVARHLRVGRERVRQIEMRALRIIRFSGDGERRMQAALEAIDEAEAAA